MLDDAIREHLELKRQRGADPGEIKQEEDEALGKVVVTRRSAGDDDASAEQSPEPTVEPVPEQDTIAFDPAELAAALGHDAAAPTQELAEEASRDDEVGEDDERDADDELLLDSDEPLEPDELELTPEFLEDAPEHDKLWFEQKPPKDFDF